MQVVGARSCRESGGRCADSRARSEAIRLYPCERSADAGRVLIGRRWDQVRGAGRCVWVRPVRRSLWMEHRSSTGARPVRVPTG